MTRAAGSDGLQGQGLPSNRQMDTCRPLNGALLKVLLSACPGQLFPVTSSCPQARTYATEKTHQFGLQTASFLRLAPGG